MLAGYEGSSVLAPNRPSRYFWKKKLELFNIHLVVWTLKEDCMPNFSQIGEVGRPAKVRILRRMIIDGVIIANRHHTVTLWSRRNSPCNLWSQILSWSWRDRTMITITLSFPSTEFSSFEVYLYFKTSLLSLWPLHLFREGIARRVHATETKKRRKDKSDR